MKKIKSLLLLTLFFITITVLGQGVTSSSISGKVKDNLGESLPGATIIVVHTESGTQYGSTTDLDGYYRVSNVRTGGPYKITFSYVGFKSIVNDNVYLSLGQTKRISVSLNEDTNVLEEVVITAQRDGLIDGNKTGSGTTIGKREIETIASASRSLADFVRLTPQTQITEGDDGFSISISGQNNRFNSIYIDGAVNNDVFGLAGSGTNGGQTGVSPFSIDAIESFQVNIAPFDVKQSGFTGGAINAVTRSGTNKFEGSTYAFVRNEDLAGKTPNAFGNDNRERLAEFSALTYGARLSGPIIKDKLFFFVNYERQEDETPQPFDLSTYEGDLGQISNPNFDPNDPNSDPTIFDLATATSRLNELTSFINGFGYDVGGFENNVRTLDSDKITAKLDWNISNEHKLLFKHTYVKSENLQSRTSGVRDIGFLNGSELFNSTTNTSSLEWNWQGDKFSNSLLLGYTSVRDDRDPLGDPFPSVNIGDGINTFGFDGITFGAEPFSTANLLETDVFTMTNNFEYYLGAHTLTFGIHNEFTTAKNLFFGRNYGVYIYNSVDDFINDENLTQYRRAYSLLSDSVGDESSGAAEFSTTQLGYYIQDAFDISDNLKITGGLRFDVPIWADGIVNDDFNTRTVALLEAAGKDLQGARVGKSVNTTANFSPRFGFNWDVKGKGKTQVRGGAGVFVSRLPLVWPGGTYNNNGVTSGQIRTFAGDVAFNPDINTQAVDAVPGSGEVGGNIDLFAPDFKQPKVLKYNIAIDQKLPAGFSISADFIYNDNLEAIFYENLNVGEAIGRLEGADNRLYYSDDAIDNTYGTIILASNTSKGSSWNTSFTLKNTYRSSLIDVFSSATYSYGESESIFDGRSSQNSSQWEGIETVDGANSDIRVSRSDFDPGHRVLVNVSADFKWSENFKTTIGLFYSGQQGQPFSYVYNGANIFNDNSDGLGLFYVPNNASEINLVDIDGGATAAQQWESLNSYIESNDYLSSRRGDYTERNGDRARWSHTLDLKVLQDFTIKVGEKKHTFQVSADIFNFTNLINKDWGTRYFANDELEVLEVVDGEGTATPSFNFDGGPTINQIDDSGIQSSRWQAQIGIRYIFN